MRCVPALALLVALLAGCGGSPAPPPFTAPAAASTSPSDVDAEASRAWLTRALTCGDRAFLGTTAEEQRARLMHLPGATCEAATNGSPLRCAIAPSLRIGQAQVGWFVLGTPDDDLVPVVLPAPPEALRTAIPAGTGTLSPGTDLGDTTVQCALSDRALLPGTVAGIVRREGDPSATVRVCAFELAEGMPTCVRSAAGERTYRLEVPRGDYLVLAVPSDAPDARVGYTDCADAADEACMHELQVVTVRAGEATEGVDPADLRSIEEAGDWPQPPPAQ